MGLDEEVVDEHEAAGGSREAGPEAAERGDGDDEEQEEEHHARQLQLVTERRQHECQEGEAGGGEDEPERLSSPRERDRATRARNDECSLRAGLGMADDVDVDRDTRVADHPADHGSACEPLPTRASRRAHDDLGRVQRAGGVEQRLPDVAAGDFVVGAAELGHELALLGEQRRGRRGEPVLRDHVHRDQVALRALRDAGGATDQALAVARAGEGDEDALTRLPRLLDSVPATVFGEALVDAVGEPGERKLAQRGQVAGPEVVGERRVDPLGRVHVAAGEAVAQRGGGEIDQLKLVGATNDLVGNRFALLHGRDLLDDVIERLEVLDVQGRDDADPGLEQLLDVLPALLVARAGHVGVRELVDERDLRPPGEHGIDVRLLELPVPVAELSARDEFERPDLLGRLAATV